MHRVEYYVVRVCSLSVLLFVFFALESPVLKWLCFMWCGAASLVLLALPKLIIDNSTTLDPQVGRLCVCESVLVFHLGDQKSNVWLLLFLCPDIFRFIDDTINSLLTGDCYFTVSRVIGIFCPFHLSASSIRVQLPPDQWKSLVIYVDTWHLSSTSAPVSPSSIKM